MNGFEMAPEYGPPFWTIMSWDMLEEGWEPHEDVEVDEEYHTYEIEWTPTYLSFSVDGEEIRRREDA